MEINTNMLKAALLCASTEHTRYYLNGVHFDPRGYMVATDGHRLFVARIPAFDGAPFITPRDAIKQALTGYKPETIDVTPERVGNIVCQPIDGTFPDWIRVLPQADPASDKPAQFNPAYVADMGKIAKLVGISSGYCHIHHNGDGPAPVTFGRDDCFAVLMPVRTTHTGEQSYSALRDSMGL